jgi:hypothetical protein
MYYVKLYINRSSLTTCSKAQIYEMFSSPYEGVTLWVMCTLKDVQAKMADITRALTLFQNE